jgi:hypothetical protein
VRLCWVRCLFSEAICANVLPQLGLMLHGMRVWAAIDEGVCTRFPKGNRPYISRVTVHHVYEFDMEIRSVVHVMVSLKLARLYPFSETAT